MKIKSIIKKIISWGIVGLILYYLLTSLINNWGRVKNFPFHFNWVKLFLSVLLYSLSVFIGSLLWSYILIIKKNPIKIWQIFVIYIYSNFGKYIPGKVWILILRLRLGGRLGISRRDIAVSTAIEMGAANLALIFLSGLIITKYIQLVELHYWLVVGIAIVLLIVIMIPKNFYFLLSWGLKIMGREPWQDDKKMKFSNILFIFFAYLLQWFSMGTAFFYFLSSFLEIPLNLLEIVGIFALSYTLGIFAVFVPNGLGVREGISVFLLKGIITMPVAIIASFLTRIWSILNDGLLFILANTIERFISNNKNSLSQNYTEKNYFNSKNNI